MRTLHLYIEELPERRRSAEVGVAKKRWKKIAGGSWSCIFPEKKKMKLTWTSVPISCGLTLNLAAATHAGRLLRKPLALCASH